MGYLEQRKMVEAQVQGSARSRVCADNVLQAHWVLGEGVVRVANARLAPKISSPFSGPNFGPAWVGPKRTAP